VENQGKVQTQHEDSAMGGERAGAVFSAPLYGGSLEEWATGQMEFDISIKVVRFCS